MHLLLIVTLLVLLAFPPLLVAQSRPRVLLLTQSVGFVHGVVKDQNGQPSVVKQVLTDLAAANGFTVSFIDDVTDLTPERLEQTDIVAFYTTGDLPFVNGQYDTFQAWIEEGGAFLGIHCATDTLKDHPRYPVLIGASFESHPWGAEDTVTIKVHDQTHPAAAPYAPSTTLKEEIYHFKNLQPDKIQVLMSLDMSKTDKKRPYHVPIAWTKRQGNGPVFYTSLGHREDVWRSEAFNQHLLGAIQWLMSNELVTPNPDLHEHETRLAREAASQ